MPTQRKPRVALVALYFDMFDDVMPPTFRQEKEAVGREVAGLLEPFADVDYSGLVANLAQAEAARRRWAAAELDAVVVFPTMASPPAFPWECTRGLGLPVLVWNGHLIREIADGFTYHDANRYSSNVGAIMITNVFRRQGAPFQLVSGYYREPDVLARVRGFVEAAAAAGRLRRARLGRIGVEIPGYADVGIDAEALESSLGTSVVAIGKPELDEAYRGVAAERIAEDRAELAAEYAVEVPEALLESSVRIALALEDLVARHRLDALAINCHSELFRRNPEIGLVACYGASRSTGRGVPVSCTGDAPTALAMLALKALGGHAQYCEFVVTDHARDAILLTNTGEGDPTIARTDRPKCLKCNAHYPGLHGGGASPVFACRGGTATMLAFSPKHGAARGHVLVAAQGEVLGTFHERTGVTNALFRFRNAGALSGFDRWCLAGAPHHGAFTLGDCAERLRWLADLWGPEFVLI
jgi:L-arabinose isomerase